MNRIAGPCGWVLGPALMNGLELLSHRNPHPLDVREQLEGVTAESHQVDARFELVLQHLLDHRDGRDGRQDVGIFVEHREPKVGRLIAALTISIDLHDRAVGWPSECPRGPAQQMPQPRCGLPPNATA